MTRAESDFQSRVRELGCIICAKYLRFNTPCDVHHLLSGTKRKGEMFVIGLCATHHRSGVKNQAFVSRHPWKREFELRYGTEAELLEETKRLVNWLQAAKS